MKREIHSLPACHFAAAMVALACVSDLHAAGAPQSAATISGVLQPFVDRHTMAGAVTLVATKEKVLSLEAVGYSDLAAKKPMRTDELFWIASMTKPVTATAFMMLVDEGKVSLDDPVEKYLPEFKGQWLAVEQDNEHMLLKRPQHPVTIRNILSHTAGFPVISPPEKGARDTLSLEARARSYAMLPLKYQPGTSYEYTNADINTAGRIIEVVTGMPYGKFMDERLFKPLGMKDTTFWPNRNQVARLAKTYMPNAENTALQETELPCTYPLNDRKRQALPAGGLFSTAADLSNFCRMLLAGGVFEGKRYLSEASLKQMTSTQTGEILINGNGLEGYGFGWVVRKQSSAGDPFSDDGLGKGAFGHKGAYKTAMWIDPQKQLAFVFLMQIAGGGKEGERIPTLFLKTATGKF